MVFLFKMWNQLDWKKYFFYYFEGSYIQFDSIAKSCRDASSQKRSGACWLLCCKGTVLAFWGAVALQAGLWSGLSKFFFLLFLSFSFLFLGCCLPRSGPMLHRKTNFTFRIFSRIVECRPIYSMTYILDYFDCSTCQKLQGWCNLLAALH